MSALSIILENIKHCFLFYGTNRTLTDELVNWPSLLQTPANIQLSSREKDVA